MTVNTVAALEDRYPLLYLPWPEPTSFLQPFLTCPSVDPFAFLLRLSGLSPVCVCQSMVPEGTQALQ